MAEGAEGGGIVNANDYGQSMVDGVVLGDFGGDSVGVGDVVGFVQL